MSRSFRIFAAIYFFLSASTLAVMFLGLGSPGVIFSASAGLLACAAPLWLGIAPIAACVSLPLVLGLTYMLYRYHFGSFMVIYELAFAGCYILIALAFHNSKQRGMLVLVSTALVALWFGLNWRFSEVIKVHTYQMNWALDGKSPWGVAGYDDKPLRTTYNGESLVIVWRQVADGYCWDGVYSNELRSRLEKSGKNTATVEYNTLWDFGQYAGKRVKSIEGVPFYEGYKPLSANTNEVGGHHWVKEPILGLCDN